MTGLTDTDLRLYEELRSIHVLEEVEPHRLKIDGGIILVTCSDGDQFPDIFEHLGSVLDVCGALRRIHTIALNGGPLLLHPHSPLATHGESAVLTAHIIEAARLKGITTVGLCAHGPCGKAYGLGLNFAQVLDLLEAGKRHLEERAPHLTMYPFGQLDHPDRRKRTYFVSGTRWPGWCASNGYRSLIDERSPA